MLKMFILCLTVVCEVRRGEERRAGREMAGRKCTFRASGFVTFGVEGGVWGTRRIKMLSAFWFWDVSKQTTLKVKDTDWRKILKYIGNTACRYELW